MAMTKVEKAQMENLRAALASSRAETRIAMALGWSGVAHPPTRAPGPGKMGCINGWTYNPHLIDARGVDHPVTKHWTESSSNGRGHRTDGAGYRSGSQGRVPVYLTERDAWVALRLHKEREFAEILARIDRQIETASTEPAPNAE